MLRGTEQSLKPTVQRGDKAIQTDQRSARLQELERKEEKGAPYHYSSSSTHMAAASAHFLGHLSKLQPPVPQTQLYTRTLEPQCDTECTVEAPQERCRTPQKRSTLQPNRHGWVLLTVQKGVATKPQWETRDLIWEEQKHALEQRRNSPFQIL